MTFPQLARFTDLGLLLLRLMVAVVFFDSGRNLGFSQGSPAGLAEIAGAPSVACGVFTQLAVLGGAKMGWAGTMTCCSSP